MNNMPKDNLRKSNQESKERTRQYIKTAFLYLLKEHPYEKISVTAIINRAGVSRAGFYRNYYSKEDVLEDIAASIYEKISVYYTQELSVTSSYERALALFQKLKEKSDWLKIMALFSAQNAHLFNMVNYIEKMQPATTPQEHYNYIAIAHSQRAIILEWFQNGMKESPEEMATIFSNIYRDIELDFSQRT